MDTKFNIGVYKVRDMHMVRLDEMINLIRMADQLQSSSDGQVIDLNALADHLQQIKDDYDEH